MAPYNVYPARDGAIAVLAVSEAHWVSLIDALGLSELKVDGRFADRHARVRNMEALDGLIGEATVERARDDVVRALVAARVPCAPVRELAEVIHDEHLHQNGMLQWTDHPAYGHILTHSTPLRFADIAPPSYRPSADLGADAQHVLHEVLGIDSDEYSRLQADGAFGKDVPHPAFNED